MELAGAIDQIVHERDFKVACDGLLHFEIGPLVQTYSAAGADKGIDAEFRGAIGGVTGRWVFQYKFRSPADAVSKRRSWLKSQYAPPRGGRGELDREGIRRADGYILMTNVPMTVSLVHALQEQWAKRRRRGPLVVWDVQRLNSMLKGREHLARSWTGFKEVRCRNQVIGPIWAWIERARERLGRAPGCPVWPLVVVSTDERVHHPNFSTPLSWRQSVGLAVDGAELDHARQDPQFAYASTVAYPRAIGSLVSVEKSQDRLVKLLVREIDATSQMLLEKLPPLSKVESHRDRADLVKALAFGFLEVTWGFPLALHQVTENGQLWVSGGRVLPCPPEIRDDLNALVANATHGAIPKDVVTARRRFATNLENAWRQFWYVVEFGIDAEVESSDPDRRP